MRKISSVNSESYSHISNDDQLSVCVLFIDNKIRSRLKRCQFNDSNCEEEQAIVGHKHIELNNSGYGLLILNENEFSCVSRIISRHASFSVDRMSLCLCVCVFAESRQVQRIAVLRIDCSTFYLSKIQIADYVVAKLVFPLIATTQRRMLHFAIVAVMCLTEHMLLYFSFIRNLAILNVLVFSL